MKNVLELLEGKNISSKKVSAAKGGEYHSACPGCGGNDRFHVWPEQNSGKGSYWCRQCGKAGDAIQFLRDFSGMSYPEACRALDVELPVKEQFRTPRVKGAVGGGAAAGWQASGGEEPADAWRDKADKLTAWAHEQLLENKSGLRWLLERGITKKLVKDYLLGWNPEDKWRHRQVWGLPEELKKDGKVKRLWIPGGLVIPMIKDGHTVRIRIRRPTGEPRYFALPGSNMDCMVLREGDDNRRLALVVESELDAVLLMRYAADLAAVIALGNSSRKPDPAAAKVLAAADLILLAVDYDAGGNNQVGWWRAHFPRVKHWPVPAGKDPGDAHKAGVDLRAWVIAGCPKGWLTAPSLLGMHPAAPASEAVEAMVEAADMPADVPAGVLELAELLKNTPVVIENSEKRTTVRMPQRWAAQNWGTSKRISHLVYFDETVFAWICGHPDDKITAENLIK